MTRAGPRAGPSAPWWRDAVIYQVYVRSFADADGDGIGDLAGVRSRLPYLRELGVDGIWLNPFYPSPRVDGGYDVSDHRAVDPRLGSSSDFDALIADAHRLGLRVLVDLVPNHTSSDHQWFRDAVAKGPGSPERARYLFRDGRGPGGDEPPNDWSSLFGGSAWARIAETDGTPGQWYLHLFHPAQPDLDWTNPEVRAEFESILRFWFDRGVDGFRIDVAHGLAKDPEMPDLAGRYAPASKAVGHPHWDLDEVHDVYRAWRRLSDGYPGDRAFVAEAWVRSAARLARYLRPDELHTAFSPDLLESPWNADAIREAIVTSMAELAKVGAPSTWVLSNHDVTREVTRYGGGPLGTRRARAAAMLMLALPGGAYVYQGEELGLPEVTDLPDEVRRDPVFTLSGGAEPGRDGCRVPLPWSGDRPPYGFGPGGRPWLPQPPAWAELTVERQRADPGSTLAMYRRAIELRRQLAALGDGDLEWLDTGPGVLAFRREPGFGCVVNLGDEPADPPAWRSRERWSELLASGPLEEDGRVPGATTVWYATA
jgi:alpha-glucosidase